MIEREAPVRIYSEILANTLGAKVAKGKLVRVAPVMRLGTEDALTAALQG